ncbi:MAG: NUDIX hydrolase [Tunicatimonas sp.]|uniref:NUDIX domain-containing protein n=1 Tax=Tunicatimonas sp. TaxID=1940096 RepID=UPI003C78189F
MEKLAKTSNPWQRLARKQVYDNPWIEVYEDQVINPSGGPGIYGKVSFKNLAIGIVPVDDEMYTWLVGQYRYTLDEYSWEIPMGGGSKADGTLVSAQRELKEETGLTARRWDNIMRIHTSNSVTDEEGFIFLAQDLTQGEPEFEDTEDIKIKRLPLTSAVSLIMEGRITDAISISGLLKVARMLNI